MHIRQKTLVSILSGARRKTVLKMAAAAANPASLSPRQRFATKTLFFFLRARPRSPRSPLAVRVFAFCTPTDRGGRRDGRTRGGDRAGPGRAHVCGIWRREGRARANAREAEAGAGATGGSEASDVALASSVLWYG